MAGSRYQVADCHDSGSFVIWPLCVEVAVDIRPLTLELLKGWGPSVEGTHQIKSSLQPSPSGLQGPGSFFSFIAMEEIWVLFKRVQCSPLLLCLISAPWPQGPCMCCSLHLKLCSPRSPLPSSLGSRHLLREAFLNFPSVVSSPHTPVTVTKACLLPLLRLPKLLY